MYHNHKPHSRGLSFVWRMWRALAYLPLALLALLLLWVGQTSGSSGVAPAPAHAHADAYPMAVTALTTLTTPTSTPLPCGLAWNVIDSPNPDNSSTNYLNGVAAVSPYDVWAVGSQCLTTPCSSLVEHWDGVRWSIVPNPVNGSLLEVEAVSANDVWAVGEYSHSGSGPRGTLIEHWDGTQWSVVPSPGPPSGLLHDLSVVSANDVWAVGHRSGETGYSSTLIEHWDGVRWSVVPSPNPGLQGNELLGVAAVSADDVWAMGIQQSHGVSRTLALHWDGATWSVVPSPNAGTIGEGESNPNLLFDAVAVAADDVWAVGYYTSDYSGLQALTLHWDGVEWTVIPSATTQGQICLYSIDALASDDVWAVGYNPIRGVGNRTLVMHWDGVRWSIVPSPSPAAFFNDLVDVSILSTHEVWAVGTKMNCFSGCGSDWETLVERYADPCAVPSPTPSPTPTVTATATPVNTTMLVGHVRWQGRPAQPHTLQQLPITLTLKLGDDEINYPQQTTDASGLFTVSVAGLAAGVYNWRVKDPQYLANSGTVTLGGLKIAHPQHTTSVELGMMRAGDANDDNLVNAHDFNIMKITFGKGEGDEGYDERADFDGDQRVNILDYNLMKVNSGFGGDPPLNP